MDLKNVDPEKLAAMKQQLRCERLKDTHHGDLVQHYSFEKLLRSHQINQIGEAREWLQALQRLLEENKEGDG